MVTILGREKSRYHENHILSHCICYQQFKYDLVKQGHKATVRIIIMIEIYQAMPSLSVSFW